MEELTDEDLIALEEERVAEKRKEECSRRK